MTELWLGSLAGRIGKGQLFRFLYIGKLSFELF